MITIIFGLPGSGKTSLLTKFAIDSLYNRERAIIESKRIMRKYNESGYKFNLNYKHLTYADYNIISKKELEPTKQSYYINGFLLGLYREDYETIFIPPYSSIFLDEAQKYYNSRVSASKFPNNVSRFYEMHRHYKLEIMLACQRPMLIDANIREIAGRFIEVLEIKKKKYLTVDGFEWKYYEYDSFAEVENIKVKKKEKTEKYIGNIFSNYSSYEKFPLFLGGREESDFSFEKLPCKVNYTPEFVRSFCERNIIEGDERYYVGSLRSRK